MLSNRGAGGGGAGRGGGGFRYAVIHSSLREQLIAVRCIAKVKLGRGSGGAS